MPRSVKVYGWTAYYISGVIPEQTNHSYRCILAATPMAEGVRICGKRRKAGLWDISETLNRVEIELARSKPGTVFYRLDTWDQNPWTELNDPTRV